MCDVENNDNGLDFHNINSLEEWVDRFHELNAFRAVVEAGGFSAAADTTGDSQSAISEAIGALEKRLGVMLFNRSTRRVTLTDQGRRYYDRTKPLIDEMQDADSELTRTTLGVSGCRIRYFRPPSYFAAYSQPVVTESQPSGGSRSLGHRARYGGRSDRPGDTRGGLSLNPTRLSGAWRSHRSYASDPVVISSVVGCQRPPLISLSTIAFCMVALQRRRIGPS